MGNTFVLSEADKKNIIDELVKKAAEDKKKITLEDCYKILTLAKEMNRKYEELNNIVAPKIQALMETSSEKIENYIKFKALSEEHQKIKSFLVDGYESLQNIRQIFTNEKIDYQVAILGKRESYEFILSEKEFLDMAQLFYDTKDLFPNFAANLGAGENIYNFSYYGLYSPIILFSYLLPFVQLQDGQFLVDQNI